MDPYRCYRQKVGASARWLPAVAVLVAMGAASCVEPQLVPCGALLCPADTTCVANEICATKEQLAACSTRGDGDVCTVGGGIGICDRGVCVPGGCGNQVTDPGEVCDDGNVVSGDGCRADCRKVEVCGDGIVDDGEACDDGNGNSADGCDGCKATTWRARAAIGGNANALAVGLSYPNGVAVDRDGNVYIADTSNHRIRRVDATGVITTLAGSGVAGFGGDGGAANVAELNAPEGVAVDGLGNIYIVDTGNNRIRRVDPSGVITTIAGNGTQCGSGACGNGGLATGAGLYLPHCVAVDGLGDLYVAEPYANRVRRIDVTGTMTAFAGVGTPVFSGDGGPSTAAGLASPRCVAVDDVGNVYIADTSNSRIRRVDPSGTINTIAGTGTYGYSGDGGPALNADIANPWGLELDDVGNLYFADVNNYRVRRVDAGGIITTVAGNGTRGKSGDGGAAIDAEFQALDIAVDAAGTLYLADVFSERIRHVDAAGIITAFAGSGLVGFLGEGGAPTSAEIYPMGVAIDSLGIVYFSDSNHARIRTVAPTGVISTVAGTLLGFSGDGGPAIDAELWWPQGIAFDAQGAKYLTDTVNQRIRKIDPAGQITTIAGNGNACSVQPCGDGGLATSAQLNRPWGITVDGSGNVYFADEYNNRVRRVEPSGFITTVAGNGTSCASQPCGDGGAATSAQLSSPRDVAVDGAGNVYIADYGTHRVRRVSPSGVITTVAGTGIEGFNGEGGPATSAQLGFPNAVAIHGTDLYVADYYGRILRVDANGTLTRVAGKLSGRSDGDGGPKTAAAFYMPSDLVVDGAGTIYVTEAYGQRVRRIDAATGLVSTVAGQVDPEGMGPLGQARLADPRALVIGPSFTLVAGGSTGTVQAIRPATSWLEVVAGRYAQPTATGTLARFRNKTFGDVGGVAYDPVDQLVFLSESTQNRLQVVTVVDPDEEETWTIAPLDTDTTGGFVDGALATAKFRSPSGLWLDTIAHQLYVADTGNHVVRAIDLSGGIANATVRTLAGVPATRGYFGDGGPATAALLYAPQAITSCGNGDLFIADTGNHRVRRIAAGTGSISTVLGVGVAASSGEGAPASTFPVRAPLGLACDETGNLFVTSTTSVRMLPANSNGVVDGAGVVQTIYGTSSSTAFPERITSCLTGLAVRDATHVQVLDSCSGVLVELQREPL